LLDLLLVGYLLLEDGLEGVLGVWDVFGADVLEHALLRLQQLGEDAGYLEDLLFVVVYTLFQILH